MPRTGVTLYDLLISCPGDVTEEIEIIRNVVESFNRMFGPINNIEVKAKHWSTDAYPQSGGKPQELLNEQFINECDAAVAVLWTRFGTPTDKYQSGTEEEIEEMIKNGKQVFLYFSDKAVNPSNINAEQYERVKEFREKYKGKGIYWTFSDKNEFEKLFLNHLTLHFLNLVTDKTEHPVQKKIPKLIVRGMQNNKPTNKLYVLKGNWLSSGFIVNKEKETANTFEKVCLITVPEKIIEIKEDRTNVNIGSLYELQNQGTLSKLNSDLFKNLVPQTTDVVIGVEVQDVILEYSRLKNIELSDKFFCLGNLKKENPLFEIKGFGSTRPSFKGTPEEQEKYEVIMDLYWKIKEYNEYIEYFSYLESKSIIKCIISNIGKSYDEDIDVRIKLPKGLICKPADFPIPGYSFIELFIKSDMVERLYKIKTEVTVDEYSGYPSTTYNPMLSFPANPLMGKTAKEEYEDYKRDYLRKLNQIFCYQYFEQEDYDIMTFNISYLKQNTNMNIPSLLYLNKVPEYIEYEIYSKYSSNVVMDKIEVEQ